MRFRTSFSPVQNFFPPSQYQLWFLSFLSYTTSISVEVVTAREDGSLKGGWENCFISSSSWQGHFEFSTNKAEDINRKRKIRTFPARVAQLPRQHSLAAQPSSLCIFLQCTCFIAIIDLLSRKYGEHMELLSILCCLFGFPFFSFHKTSIFIVLFIPNWSNPVKKSHPYPCWCI